MTRESTGGLWICQQNVNKSLVAQSDILHQLDPNIYDIAAIQELYLNHNHNTCTNLHWYTVYPKEHYTVPYKTRSIMLVNMHMATDSWAQVNFSMSGMTVIQIQMVAGNVLIINTYNHITCADSVSHVLQTMRAGVRATGSTVGTENMIWLGDFNRHHPAWDKA